MPPDEIPPLFQEFADRLRADADKLTERWIDELSDRLGVRPRRLLPTEELRDHIPDVLKGAADYMALPIAQLPNETTDILRSVAQLRREQGYDIQEVLLEIGLLADLVFEWAAEWVEELKDGSGAGEAMRAAARLSALLRKIATVSVGTYREEELRHGRDVADRLSDFASMLSHELMSPLNTAGVSATLLTDEAVADDPEKRQKHAEVIRDRLERVHHLIDDVRALAVAEGARAEPRWVSMRRVVHAVLEEVQEAADRENVELSVEEPLDDFDVDAVRVEIALMNLVTNAIKFSDPEKEKRWVRVTTGPAESNGLEGGRRITVEDNGRGIAPESQNKVFQRFFRGIPEVEGTGLGLEIAKRVVEQRGGKLWFESEPGEGSVFIIEIPPRLESAEKEPGDVRP